MFPVFTYVQLNVYMGYERLLEVHTTRKSLVVTND